MSRVPISKSILCVLLVVVTSGVAICAYAKWEACREREDAEHLLVELRGLRVGESTLDEVNEIAAHHRGYHRSLLKPEPAACDNGGDKQEACFFDFGYENSLLSRLGLASRLVFGVRVQIHQSRVDLVSMSLLCGVFEPTMFGVIVEEAAQSPTEPRLVTPFSNRPSVVWVRLTPHAPDRDRAYSLSLKCFDRIGRCHNRGELLPSMVKEVAETSDTQATRASHPERVNEPSLPFLAALIAFSET